MRQSRITTLIKPIKPALMTGGMLAASANLLWLWQSWIIATLIAGFLDKAEPALPFLIAAFVTIGIIRSLLSLAGETVTARAAERFITGLRREIITTELGTAGATSYGGAGAITALAIDKTDGLRPYLTRYYPASFRTLIVPLVILAATVTMNWAAGLLLAITAPMIPLFMILIGWAAQSASQKHMSEIASINDYLVDRLGAGLDFRLLGASEQCVAGFTTAAESLRDRTMAVLRIAFLSSTVLELFAAIGVAMVAVFLGFTLLGEIGFGSTGATVTAKEVIWLLLLAPEFFQPLRDLAAAWHDKATGEAVADDIANWRQAERSAPLMSGFADIGTVPSISVSGLSIRLGANVIRYPDFDVRRGESIAITGPSGTGKTSLLQCIAGILPAETGQIVLGQALLSNDTAGTWRAMIGWMPQSPAFVDGTIRYNVAFDEAADIWPALKLARVDSVVAAIPDQESLVLGETGGGLSGGEARRIMLARAVYRNPAFLVADEPTADLDDDTKAAIIATFRQLQDAGTTLIVATHDPALIAALDREVRVGTR